MSLKKSISILFLLLVLAALALVLSSRMGIGETVIIGGTDDVFVHNDNLKGPLDDYGGEPEANEKYYGLRFPEVDINAPELLLINSENIVKDNAPELKALNDDTKINALAAKPLADMLKAAEKAGFKPAAESGYISYTAQQELFNNKAMALSKSEDISFAEARDLAKSYLPSPGTSDHQTGLGVVLVQKEGAEAKSDAELISWLDENCAEFGFIKRYPSDQKGITGWSEDNYYRYVGVDAAKFMSENGICLESFIAHYSVKK